MIKQTVQSGGSFESYTVLLASHNQFKRAVREIRASSEPWTVSIRKLVAQVALGSKRNTFIHSFDSSSRRTVGTSRVKAVIDMHARSDTQIVYSQATMKVCTVQIIEKILGHKRKKTSISNGIIWGQSAELNSFNIGNEWNGPLEINVKTEEFFSRTRIRSLSKTVFN
ncbi:hypothetical protein WA026_014704 [Henosepilachna vigintioctopunctata]|uniref:Uncharacterized protein n=1 Tax=Henosepilachna vigintioctopunctata TaxID=420089 RepID=A0AAW1VEV8_9CUCU